MGGLTIRRAVSGDMNAQYETSMWIRFEGAGASAQPPRYSVATSRYVGPCWQAAPIEGASADKTPSTIAATFWFIAVVILQMAAFAVAVYGSIMGMAWLSRRLMARAYARASVANITVDGAGAATIPVLATFTGVRGLPWWYGIASNNAKPLLVIEPEGIRFRVIRQTVRRFEEIEIVDVRQATGTVNLDITFTGDLLTFAANLGAVPLAAHVLSLLPPSVPLSSRAVALKEARA